MENKELFAPILQEDEEIIKVIKPNKTRYVYLGGLAYTLLALIPILVMAAPLCMAIEAFKENGAPQGRLQRAGTSVIFSLWYPRSPSAGRPRAA